jgi:hypothetical protein
LSATKLVAVMGLGLISMRHAKLPGGVRTWIRIWAVTGSYLTVTESGGASAYVCSWSRGRARRVRSWGLTAAISAVPAKMP